MSKSPEMRNFLDHVAQNLFGQSYNQEEKCVTCGSDKVRDENFRNDLSRREWEISHMCQKCQDSVFGED